MQVTSHDEFDQTVETLFEPFTLASEIERKYRGMGARNIEILEMKSEGDVLRVKTRREIPTDVPRLLQRFAGEWNTLIQTEAWRVQGEGREASITVEIQGVPAQVAGEVRMRPREAGSQLDMEFEVKSSVPLVGRKIAEFVAGITSELLAKEADFLRERGHALGG